MENIKLFVSYIVFYIKFLGDPDIVCNLIRFINEFWYVKTDKYSDSVEDIIKKDSSNSNINFNMKLKKFDSIEDILTNLEKYKDKANK